MKTSRVRSQAFYALAVTRHRHHGGMLVVCLPRQTGPA